ncbi:hypothetical protein K493DRAFT_305956 [Basidiobolus meristosporus CBS 931.73]|uniref:Cyclin-domain-containing protein n=1 Tax=Basidiobolus meristosporus CBS 931.73 TaxID=1314790 RepID=A0A1Y1XUN5_9FUNG|nr:hypothetical protein K493DRAFT_305956 [Basidiobolus meristosporus CBS 931.73]|eukprot:ORX89206.1 hypothetical protein K493DRAFT_305956 [Basidiobolus meristosporus CBS 931.73]
MQTQNFPTGYTLVTGQTQHWNNDSAPLLRRQAAFCGSGDSRVLSGPQQHIEVPPLSQNPSTTQDKISFEENTVTPFNINAPPGYLRQPQTKPIPQTNNFAPSSHETLPKAARQNHKPQSCPPTPSGQLPGSVKCNKADFVESLVDVAAMIIESIWPNHSASTKTKILPLRVFIRETLQRSRTSFSTLQTALFYLFRVKDLIPRSGGLSSATKEMGQTSPPMSPVISVFDIGLDGIALPTTGFPFPSPPLTPAQVINHGPGSQDSASANKGNQQCHSTSLDPVYCARRMFLASLIVASKFLQDKNYSNKAWAKITGLSSSEINHNEIAFLRLIDYRLFVPPTVFARWSSMLINYINHSQAAKAANAAGGDSSGLSVMKSGIVAQFSGESNANTACSNPVKPGVGCPQSRASVHSDNVSTACSTSEKILEPSSICQQNRQSIGVATTEAVCSKRSIANCVQSESRASSIQCSSTATTGGHIRQLETGEFPLVQQMQIGKIKYVRECISNIRKQHAHCESKQRSCSVRSSVDSATSKQLGVKVPVGYRCKPHAQYSPYPTASQTKSIAGLQSSEFCPNQPMHFVNLSPALSSPSPVLRGGSTNCDRG